MKFSIITICLNPGETMRYVVDSVLGQQYSDINYVIIDGGSTDGTGDYVRSLGGKISKFISEPDRGIYDALNKGVRLAAGEVIGIIHADDMYPNAKVVSSVAEAFKRTGSDAVYGDLIYVDKKNPDKMIRFWRSGEFSPNKLRRGWMPPHPALFVRREIYEKARMLSGEYFDTSFKIAADYDFMMRLLGRMKISVAYLPLILVKMRVGGKSNNSLKNIILKSREDYIAMKRNHIGGFSTLLSKNLRKIPQFFLNTDFRGSYKRHSR